MLSAGPTTVEPDARRARDQERAATIAEQVSVLFLLKFNKSVISALSIHTSGKTLVDPIRARKIFSVLLTKVEVLKVLGAKVAVKLKFQSPN